MTKTSYIVIAIVLIVGILLAYWYVSVQKAVEILPEPAPTKHHVM